MANTKQPHLNGAYYGPSIPLPSKSYHRPGGLCNPFSFLLNCLCTCLCQILCTNLVVGIVVVVCLLIFRPCEVKFYSFGASLTQFNLDNNMLQYNLVVNPTILNPNHCIGVYYEFTIGSRQPQSKLVEETLHQETAVVLPGTQEHELPERIIQRTTNDSLQG